jgi:hypothetical protein
MMSGNELQEAAAAAVGKMPGYTKLLEDQEGILEDLAKDEGFSTPKDLEMWLHEVVAHALGRRREELWILVSERTLPFLLATMQGKTPQARVFRRRLGRWLVKSVFGDALRYYSEKAREEPRVVPQYIMSGRATARFLPPLPPPGEEE